jgi:hypothetical protein
MLFGWFRRKASIDEVSAADKNAAALAAAVAAWQAALKPPPKPARNAQDTASIAAARQRFIAFRKIYPPPRDPGLSFYGGAPIGPVGMEWPRGDADRLPLTFIMQWDAAALAAEDATGLLPRDGAIYLFSNLAKMFRFVHVSGDARDWAPLAEPHDLPPIFGHELGLETPLTSRYMPAEQRHLPRLLPRWPFNPVGVDYPQPTRFWTDRPEVKEALLRAQDPRAMPIGERNFPTRPFERPFPAFPHDWAAVRVVASRALDALASQLLDWKRFMPEADKAAVEALTATLRQEALSLYDQAAAYPAAAAVPQDRADTIWRRIEHFDFLPSFYDVIRESVNLSLGLGSEGAAAIPPELIEACARWHRLASLEIRDEYEPEFKRERGLTLSPQEVSAQYNQAKLAGELKRVRDVHASPPNRMFGPPSEVQGDAGTYINDWLLLLELNDSPQTGIPLCEGVLQFMIRPEDLRARRFDQVELIITGY